jgi:hypothetical protein
MKHNGGKKRFDAVKMMRAIRDRLDRQIATMTFTEEKAYLKRLAATQPVRPTKPKQELVQK